MKDEVNRPKLQLEAKPRMGPRLPVCNNFSVEMARKLVGLPSLILWIPLMDTIYVPVPVQHHFGNLHKYCQIKMSNHTNLKVIKYHIGQEI